MTAPRLDIDLGKIHHNARTLVSSLATRGISVTGVTKATLGSPDIADALLRAGVTGLGDARIENIEAMRRAGLTAPMTLIRSPMISQVDRIVRHADVSFNTEPAVITRLAGAALASRRAHGIVLMVELGDLREGIMPSDVVDVVRHTLGFPNLELKGLGTNLACQSGVVPGVDNMAELSSLATSIEAAFGLELDIVSGGNSGNLHWALSGADTGRIDDLRLGESILLGREPLHRRRLEGLYTDAVTLVAEVIEAKDKPSQPWGELGQTAFGERPPPSPRGATVRTIVAIGHQDVDPSGLLPAPGIEVLGASSDHVVLDAGGRRFAVGAEIAFQLSYSALVRAMTSPFVGRVVHRERASAPAQAPAPASPGSRRAGRAG